MRRTASFLLTFLILIMMMMMMEISAAYVFQDVNIEINAGRKEDVDESEDKTDDDCGDNAVRINTDGGYNCACGTGYSGNGTSCTDLDECAEKSHDCDVNAICLNTVGAYTCTCRPGYIGNGIICLDINECLDQTNDCDVNAICLNTAGDYTCTCRTGYTGNGTSCTDIDECADQTNDCDINAICLNTAGDYTCTCHTGYTGNGTSCTELPCVHPNFAIPGIKGCAFVVKEWKTWFEASRHCSQHDGGRLLEGWDSNNQSELISDYVDKALGGTFNLVWVGSKDRRWVEGKADVPSVLFYYGDLTAHFLKNNPYGHLYTGDKRLFDRSGSNSFRSVCQRTSPPPPSSSSSSSTTTTSSST